MYAMAIDVPIELATQFIDMIQKAFSNKESSLTFRSLITKVANLGKVP
jgi:hypothetical protein